MNPAPELLKNPHFARYYNTWQKNPASIVFIPLAELYREQGLFEEAREVCLKGLESHPQSIGGLLMLARVCFDTENYKEARKLLLQILSEIPGHRETQMLLKRIDAASPAGPLGDLDADPNSDSGIRGEGPNGPAGDVGSAERAPAGPAGEAAPLFETCTMAEVYAAQGEKRTALEIIKNILSRNPTDERARRLEVEWSRS